MRDFADYAEDVQLIASAEQWMQFRGFSNVIMQEYEDSMLQQNLEDLRRQAPIMLTLEAHF